MGIILANQNKNKMARKLKLKKPAHFTLLRAKRAKKEKFLVFCLLIVANFGKSQLLNRARFG